ncbi:MAG: FtsX-like permease family protein [Saprospiraceae bacterium]
MLKNYFSAGYFVKIAWRNFLNNKGYSAINLGGLAVGMAVAMLIGMWIYDEMNYDKYHQNYNQLAWVLQNQTFNGHKSTDPSLPIPLLGEMKTKYGSNFKYLAMTSWQGGHILSLGEKKLTVEGNYMGADIAKMLTLKMIAGNYDGLQDPHSIFLSESSAKAIFGDEEPFGKTIKIDNKLDVKVSGIYEDLPYHTQFRKLKFIAPFDLYVASESWVKQALEQKQWGNNSFQMYVQIADNTSFESVNSKIINVKQDIVPADEKKYLAEIFLQPMKDWRLNSNFENGVKTGGFIQYVWLFGIVGLFVLLLACINFMNLSTARSEKRSREVGIRKAIGSDRSQLISQFFGETLLVVLMAFGGACMTVALLLPWFNQVTAKQMVFPYTQPFFWLMSIGFIGFTSLVAGIYPALYLSSFQPVKVLKGTFKAGRFASLPRKVLVVIQFSVSIALIIGTIVVFRQIQYVKNRPLGFNNNGIVMVPMSTPEYYGKYDLIRNELKGNGTIVEMTESSSPLTGIWSNNGGFNWQGKDPNLDAEFATIWVTHDYGKTVGWEFTDGRDFSRDFSTDTIGFVINESAVKFMNIQHPIGTVMDWNDKKYTILGVVKDMLMQSPYEPVKQAVFILDYNNVNWVHLKLNPNKPVSESLSSLEVTFKKYVPSAPFDYKFADKTFNEKFESEERIGKLASFFAMLAIFISCLGLFGLASFVAEQRTKEIGIRKVVGASVINLWSLLSKEFILLVLISCLIAIPLSYYYMHGWLQNYKYRTEIGWGVFVLAMAGALAITILTVSFQAIKAALANPIKSLRTE